MFSKFTFSKSTYLAATAFFSVGVLSGCEYCLPVLAALLVMPLVGLAVSNLQTNAFAN